MKVRVDPERCQGHLRCIQFAPAAFDVDDEGHASAADVLISDDQVGGVRRAVDNCPERAITIVP